MGSSLPPSFPAGSDHVAGTPAGGQVTCVGGFESR